MADELDRLINATLVPGFAGVEPPAWLDRLIDEGLGGVCLYGDQLVDSGSVPRITGYLRGHRGDLLVALDEEGGDVTRLDYLTGSRYPGNYALGKVDDVALTRSVARAIGADLADAGVNVNYSPSVDVNCDPDNPVIGVRSFGADPARVAAHGAAYVAGLQECGVVACAKHFPGHGATRTDSHLDLPVIDADLGTFHRRELPPFVSAVTAGAKMVMTSHVRFSALDELPATLSRTILTGLLRDDLGYDGVIVTDALDMQAVRRTWGIPGAAVLALAAGADMLCLGSEDGWEHCEAIRSAVRAAIAVGELSVARLEQAEQRVRRLAAWAASPHRVDGAEAGVGLLAARRAVRGSGSFGLTAPAFVVELRSATNLAVGEAHWSLAEPLASLGLVSGAEAVTAFGPDPEDVLGRAGTGPLVVVVRDAYRHPWQRDWLATVLAKRPDAVVVAIGLDADRDLAGEAFVATYGAGRVNTLAAAEVIAGVR